MATSDQLVTQQKAGKAQIDMRDAIMRLQNNRDFKRVINDEFMVQECARYAQVSSDPALKADERADALAIAQSAGHLKRWLQIQCRMGNVAEDQMQELEDEIINARAEEELAANQSDDDDSDETVN